MKKLPVNHIHNLIEKIISTLDITYLLETQPKGNVCFINSEELRDDYKISFKTLDALDYSYALLQSPTYREKFKDSLIFDDTFIPYPNDTATFWALVSIGKSLRRALVLKNPTLDNVNMSRYKDIILALIAPTG